MKVDVELFAGNNMEPTQRDMQLNIDALRRYKDGKQLCGDFMLIIDTISILEGIKAKLRAD